MPQGFYAITFFIAVKWNIKNPLAWLVGIVYYFFSIFAIAAEGSARVVGLLWG